MKPFHVFVLAMVFLAFEPSRVLAVGGFTKPEVLVSPQPRLSDDLIAKPCSAYAQMQINEYGFVTEATIVQSSDPRLNEPVLQALRRWKFKPATEGGQPVSCFVVQPVRISGGIIVTQAEARADRDPVVRASVKPELPRELRTVDGYVTVRVELDAEGVVTKSEISDSTHAELDPFVLQAVAKWTFSPAWRGGKNAPSRLAIPFRFKPDPKSLPRDVRRAEEMATDSGPVPLRRVSPDVPASVVGAEASAEVEFIVDTFGNVMNATLLASTHDAFAASALEAIVRWRFKPAVVDGQPVATRVRQQFTMQPQMLTVERGLVDSRPKVRKSVAPEVPVALRGVKGQVDVLVAIDESGNVTDAQVRNASYEEFSAPAVAAVREWKFAAAVKDGQPVASSAVVPFVFNR